MKLGLLVHKMGFVQTEIAATVGMIGWTKHSMTEEISPIAT